MKETNKTSRNLSNWTDLIRKYLALRDENFLRSAISAAERDEETEIVYFLESFGKGNMEEIPCPSDALSQKLKIQNRTEENLIIGLLKIDLSERLLRTFSGFPANKQKEKWEIGEAACRQAIDFSRRLNDRPCESYYLLSLSNGLFAIGQYAKALTFFTQALKIYQTLVKKERGVYAHKLADTLNGLGAAQHYSDKFEEAIESYQEALREYEKLTPNEPEIYESKQATTLNNLGIARRELNRLEEAVESQKKALAKARELAEKNPAVFAANVAVILNSLGTTQSRSQLFSLESKHSFEEALEIRQKLAKKNPGQFTPLVAQSLNNLGVAYLDLGQYRDAVTTCEKALQEYQKLAGHQPQYLSKVAQTSNNLGNIFRKLKDHRKALEFYLRAVENYRETAKSQPLTYQPLVAIALNNLGTSYSELRQFPEALKAYREALKICRKLAEKQPFVYNPNVAITNNNIGNLYVLRLNWKKALGYYTKARKIVENLYETVHDLNLKKNIFQKNIEVYKGLFTCYTKLEEWEKALEILEHGKSRSLNDLLNLTVVRPKFSLDRTPAANELENLDELGTLFRQKWVKIQQADSTLLALHRRQAIVAEVGKQFPKDSKIPLTINVIGKEIEEVQKEKTGLIEERNNYLRKIHEFDKNFPPKAELLSARQIFEISEKSNKAMVVFRVSGNGTFIFVVFPDGDLKPLEIKEFTSGRLNEIVQKWSRFNSENLRRDKRDANFANDNSFTLEKDISESIDWQIKTVLSELYRELFEPVHDLLKTKSFKEVLLVPNNALAILPLHACCWQDGNKTHYLLDEYTISYSTSISVFKHAWDNSQTRKLKEKFLFITNPTLDLAFSETEVDKIIATFGLSPKKYKDFRREKAVKKDIKKMLETKPFSIYHFSCHGDHNLENPFSSSLTLSDEKITLKEIMEANLSEAWLTTLSACKTGLVNYAEMTDEHYGFPLGFIFAGCPSVWATLWSVEDQSTSELIQKAYSFLREGKLKSEALRQAQIEYKKKKEGTLYSSPFFWAGFQHYGV
jgi:CHAT domain-containing protein/Flp pilus assembly protein TadD